MRSGRSPIRRSQPRVTGGSRTPEVPGTQHAAGVRHDKPSGENGAPLEGRTTSPEGLKGSILPGQIVPAKKPAKSAKPAKPAAKPAPKAKPAAKPAAPKVAPKAPAKPLGAAKAPVKTTPGKPAIGAKVLPAAAAKPGKPGSKLAAPTPVDEDDAVPVAVPHDTPPAGRPSLCLIEIVKDGHFFIARTDTASGAKEYKNTVFEDLLTEMLITLQEQLAD